MIAINNGFLQSLEMTVSKISLFASVLFRIWFFLIKNKKQQQQKT